MPFSVIKTSSEEAIDNTPHREAGASVAPLGGGGWVVTWAAEDSQGDGYGIYQQLYGADGAPIGAPVLVADNDFRTSTSVTVLSDGGWAVSWSAMGDIYQQRFDQSGARIGVPTRVNTQQAGVQDEPVITSLQNGGWTVTWSSSDGSSPLSIRQQLYDSRGSPVGTETQVNLVDNNSHLNPSVAALSDGGWVVTWYSQWNIYQQRYDLGGNAIGPVTLVDPHRDTSGAHDVIALEGGGWVVSWSATDSQSSGIYQLRYDQNGVPSLGGPVLVNTVIAGGQSRPAMTAMPDGGWIVSWLSEDGYLYQKRFNQEGVSVRGEMKINVLSSGPNQFQSVVALSEDEWIVVWTVRDAADNQLRYRHFSETTGAILRPGAEHALGTDEAETLSVSAGGLDVGDILVGGGGTDTLLMTASGTLDLTAPTIMTGFEIVRGSAGDDIIVADATHVWNLALDGGDGTNTLPLRGSTFNLSIANLSNFASIALTATGGADVTVADIGTALRLRGAASNDDSVTLTGDETFSVEQRRALFRNGIETVTDGSGTYIAPAPTDISISVGGTVAENAQIGASVATLATQDPDGGTHIYTIVANQNGDALPNGHPFFAIGTGVHAGKIVLRASLDDAQVGTHDLWIRSQDQDGFSVVRRVTVTVNNVNEAPTDVAIAAGGRVRQDAEVGATVATLSTADPDAENTHSYTIVADAGGTEIPGGHALFQIQEGTNRIVLRTALAEVNRGAHDVWIRSEDQGGLVTIKKVTVTVTEPAMAPSDIQLSNAAVRESSTNNTLVGVLSATDGNQADTMTYTFTNALAGSNGLVSADGRFKIVPVEVTAGGEIRYEVQVANGFRLDFEQARAHTIKVTVTDENGLSFTRDLTINVTDLATESTAGSAANDVFKAGAGRDVLRGNAGNDKLYGGAGNDKLYGDAGNDTLYGSSGIDTLYGGSGSDIFVMNTKPSKTSNLDTVGDFSVRYDSFWFDNAIFKKLGSGSATSPRRVNKEFFITGTAAKERDDYLIYNKKTGVLYYDADGSGSGRAVEVVKLAKYLGLTYSDFLIV
ncbi:hypothetical protein [Microvirga pakistanensis]|uniref:hypothetical protein n=1 Tax=Microvirga pakistanensis TaxID=1682650 RepID=UPI00106995BF|nr:hypothetical protein [Microvirga pakistanensis]